MTAHLQMDEQGRVLILQELREALGLRPGEPLDAEVEGGRLVIRSPASRARLVEFEGRLVFVGGPPITGDPVQDMRDERLQEMIDRCK
ncbi:transcriptional regulator, AbrB family [Deinococcus aerius]|uniref:Transcriptional regulator, AbrB family n=1 Tax=Deinococcus aerius TaxID=200253 RepID=A0A2I9DFT6_9DEIO|nr:AbrB/MazE/SpoVT family DNA-binding domain-containing protein [Deinococcus aerius]GBF04948.1 transcriptional regulator, AbrB family [Deinococcus aerius]